MYAGGVALSTAALATTGAAGPLTELVTVAGTWSLTTITRFALLRDATLPTGADGQRRPNRDGRHCGHCGQEASR